jgi:hypothetical protein
VIDLFLGVNNSLRLVKLLFTQFMDTVLKIAFKLDKNLYFMCCFLLLLIFMMVLDISR